MRRRATFLAVETPPLPELVPVPAVWKRLGQVETRLHEVTEAEDAFLTKIARHLIDAGGKRYRPLLAQVTAELGTISDDYPIEAGVSVELVHIGSLYHDDVIDEADERRGASSVNTNWSNTIAILAGDFLLARASEVAAPLGEEAVTLIAQTYAKLVEGQVLELQLTDDLVHGPDEYFKVIGGKTASLIRTSARLGAMAARADEAIIEAVSHWAWEMGLVFQMSDDVLDLVATDQYLGKPVGSDIGEGTFTLPVLYAMEGRRADELKALLAERRPYPSDTVASVLEIVRNGGYVDRALDEAAARLRAADESVDSLPQGEIPDILRRLGRYLLDRAEAARAT